MGVPGRGQRLRDALRNAEYGFPRTDLRRRLVQAILSGEKTSTTGLLAEYEHEGPLPQVGERFLLIDELDRAVGVIETTEIRITTVSQVDLPFAIDEGEGFTSVAEWREAHENFFNSDASDVAVWTGDPDWHLTDDTEIVCERFRLVERYPMGH